MPTPVYHLHIPFIDLVIRDTSGFMYGLLGRVDYTNLSLPLPFFGLGRLMSHTKMCG